MNPVLKLRRNEIKKIEKKLKEEIFWSEQLRVNDSRKEISNFAKQQINDLELNLDCMKKEYEFLKTELRIYNKGGKQ